ncbi:ATP-binding protein (plasmid) [Haloferax sp. S1W]|uniref:ATP-binding protein n=1 Tax=Haloferax sp. S1W TaxID=3377110 RepID=UPI0037C79A03
MVGDSSDADHYVSRPEIEEQLFKYVGRRVPLVHIAGEPGVGKTWVLSRIQEEYDGKSDVEVRAIGEHYQIKDLYRVIFRSILEHLPDDLKEEGRKWTGVSGSAAGFGAGVSWGEDSPEAPDIQLGYRDVLKRASELIPDDKHLVICIDDVHKLSTDNQAVRDAIREAAETTTNNLTLVTAGRLGFDDLDTAVTVSTFSPAQSVSLLQQAFSTLNKTAAEDIHDQVGGHPLYLGLIIESNKEDELPEVPNSDVYNEIEKRYLRSLSDEEERFLLSTSPIHVLDESVCARVTSDRYGVDQVEASRLLRALSDRVIVQRLGRNRIHLKQYKIHDTFRQFLLQRLDKTALHEAHSRAFAHYAEQTIELIESDNKDLEREVDSVFPCLHHLSENIAESSTDALVELIDVTLAEGGLSVYPAILLLDELKLWNAESLPESVVDTLILRLDNRPKVARHFYDEEADISWAEELFRRDRFDNPDNLLVGYLNRIADNQPDFILKVIQNTSTEDDNLKHFFISLASDLPAADAAKESKKIALWIRTTEAYHDLAIRGLDLVKHLCENDEFSAATDILDAVLHPRPENTGKQLQQDQGMTHYTITSTFEEIFNDLLEEQSDKIVPLLKSKLDFALQSEDKEGNVKYEVIARRESLGDLNYSDEHYRELKHLLLEYFTEAAAYWVEEYPDRDNRREFLENLLSGPAMFRRIGFFLLGNHPDVFSDLVEAELLSEENYRDGVTDYEFYRLLEKGFDLLDEEPKQQVCEIIRRGPYTDDIEERAEWLAENNDESTNYFEKRIIEKWRRDRLHLIANSLPGKHAEYLKTLQEKYGDPEQSLTQSRRPEVTGGFVNQRGPESTDELIEQPPREVLTKAVEWEPPQSELWEKNEEGQMEEYNHLGFSRQLSDLIKEHPERYAREISILEDANTRYAQAAFRAFQEVLDDEMVFSWDSIVQLCQTVVSDPEKWSNSCRTNIAKLLNKGIHTDTTSFPEDHVTEIREILLTLVEDHDPDEETDQPSEGMAGYGEPTHVAINSTRPMALNALLTFAGWLRDERDRQELDDELRYAVRTRITDDFSLAVRSVIGRRIYQLWNLDENLVEQHIEDIFPRGSDTIQRKLFIAAWNQYAAHNSMWGVDLFRPYYVHAIDLLENEYEGYSIASQPTAAHVASSYIFGEEELSNDNSLIFRFYEKASPETAADLATAIASKAEKDDVLDEYWNSVRDLWSWRLDTLEADATNETKERTTRNEARQFLKCVRNTATTTLESEERLIVRTLPFIADYSVYWRMTEEWLSETSERHPRIAIKLYQELVSAVSDSSWSNIARTSREEHRKKLYENAVTAGDDPRQIALRIANHFVAEGLKMDRDFMDEHMGTF